MLGRDKYLTNLLQISGCANMGPEDNKSSFKDNMNTEKMEYSVPKITTIT